METITIPKNEYKQLLTKARAYQQLAMYFYKNAMNDTAKNVTDDFRKTNRYSEEFLIDLEDGLSKSSYFRRKR